MHDITDGAYFSDPATWEMLGDPGPAPLPACKLPEPIAEGLRRGLPVPTSIGANPQLSIYGITNRLAQGLARRLGADAAILA